MQLFMVNPDGPENSTEIEILLVIEFPGSSKTAIRTYLAFNPSEATSDLSCLSANIGSEKNDNGSNIYADIP